MMHRFFAHATKSGFYSRSVNAETSPRVPLDALLDGSRCGFLSTRSMRAPLCTQRPVRQRSTRIARRDAPSNTKLNEKYHQARRSEKCDTVDESSRSISNLHSHIH